MDILVMSGFVPRPFKYLSKSEIMDIPVIGWAMNLAKHVFLKRDDLKSTMEVYLHTFAHAHMHAYIHAYIRTIVHAHMHIYSSQYTR